MLNREPFGIQPLPRTAYASTRRPKSWAVRPFTYRSTASHERHAKWHAHTRHKAGGKGAEKKRERMNSRDTPGTEWETAESHINTKNTSLRKDTLHKRNSGYIPSDENSLSWVAFIHTKSLRNVWKVLIELFSSHHLAIFYCFVSVSFLITEHNEIQHPHYSQTQEMKQQKNMTGWTFSFTHTHTYISVLISCQLSSICKSFSLTSDLYMDRTTELDWSTFVQLTVKHWGIHQCSTETGLEHK